MQVLNVYCQCVFNCMRLYIICQYPWFVLGKAPSLVLHLTWALKSVNERPQCRKPLCTCYLMPCGSEQLKIKHPETLIQRLRVQFWKWDGLVLASARTVGLQTCPGLQIYHKVHLRFFLVGEACAKMLDSLLLFWTLASKFQLAREGIEDGQGEGVTEDRGRGKGRAN